MMHCGMEVVLPTGKVVRTGMGALPDNNTWQLFQYGFVSRCISADAVSLLIRMNRGHTMMASSRKAILE